MASFDAKRTFNAISGADGRFEFHDVPPGGYRIECPSDFWSLERVRAADGSLKRRRLIVPAGSIVRGIVAEVSAPGLIRGRVAYEDGEPAWGVLVSALPAAVAEDCDRNSEGTLTNSRGEYELAGLPEGAYVVVAVPEVNTRFVFLAPSAGRIAPEGKTGYAHTFYPGVSSLRSASPVAVRRGSEVVGIDISLRPVPLVSVRGHVRNSVTNQPLSGTVSITAIGASGFLRPPDERETTTGPEGVFRFDGIPAGSYSMKGWGGQGEEHWSVTEEIFEVGSAPVVDAELLYVPRRKVAGRVIVESARPLPAIVEFRVSPCESGGGQLAVDPKDGAIRENTWDEDVTLRLPEEADPGLYIKSTTLDGQPGGAHIVVPSGARPIRLEILLGDGAGQIVIDVEDSDGYGPGEVKVAVIPAEGDILRLGPFDIKEQPDGKFLARRVPPGLSTVLAWTGANPCDFTNRASCRGRGISATVQSGGVHEVRVPLN
ncbi:MAG: collagen binding domain-containing protein [Bryobacteraceae bacterium]